MNRDYVNYFGQDGFNPNNVAAPQDSADLKYKSIDVFHMDDTVFKGVALHPNTTVLPTQLHNFDDSCIFTGLKHMREEKKGMGLVINVDEVDLFAREFCSGAGEVVIPKAPFVILPTSFQCFGNATPNDIVDCVCEGLTNLSVSFEFISAVSEFNAVYVNGSIYLKFQVHIYEDSLNVQVCEDSTVKKLHPYIIEFQRFSGDGFAFNFIYNEVKNMLLSRCGADVSKCSCSPDTTALNLTDNMRSEIDNAKKSHNIKNYYEKCVTASCVSTPRNQSRKFGFGDCPLSHCPSSEFGFGLMSRASRSCSVSSNDLCCSSDSSEIVEETVTVEKPLSEDEKTLYLAPILNMTRENALVESQLEGCRLLCDMALSTQNFHGQMCESGCIETLIRLFGSPDFITSQHAVIALAELTNHQESCPESIQRVWNFILQEQEAALKSRAFNAQAKESFVSRLFSTAVDGAYFSSSKRIEAANLLVNIMQYAAALACNTLENKQYCSSVRASSGYTAIVNYCSVIDINFLSSHPYIVDAEINSCYARMHASVQRIMSAN